MKLAAATLFLAADALVGTAQLELTTTDRDGYKGFSGGIKVFTGRNCVNNPSKGFICDFKYQTTIAGLSGGRITQHNLPVNVDSNNDLLMMTYRSSDEAIFSAMRLKVTTSNGSSDIVDLMNLDGGGQDYTTFDYDSILHPCNSGYFRKTSCRFDVVYDLKSRKEKPHYSLFSGHVVKYNNYRQPALMPRYEPPTAFANTSIRLKTGGALGDDTDGLLNIYYGKGCNQNVCTYTKELSVALSGRGKVFDYYLPDFNWNTDQLIMDFRDSDDLRLDEMTFAPCSGTMGCASYDLFSFGTSGRYKAAFDYDGPEEPCSGRYGDYTCMYDAVYDFKQKKLYKGSSVIMGQ